MPEEKKKPGRPMGSLGKKKKKKKKKPPAPKRSKDTLADEYERKKESSARRDKLKSMLGRDIGAIPPVVDQKRRDDCEFKLRLFCERYFKAAFSKPWSPDHLKAIAKLEDAILRGGLFALAMPRGSGKTTLVEAAAIWALVYSHRSFVALIGSDETAATDMLDSIKSEFEHNDFLYDDFPQICVPIRAIDGTVQRAHSQLCDGKRTEIKWKGKEIVLPTIKGSKSSGSAIKCAGITGRIRGMKRKLSNGKNIRPDLAIIDDPQTDESAKSVKQNYDRLEVITGAVLNLAGPGEKIAGFMPCTVIREGDMADTVLDPTLYPEWRGQRTRMIIKFPTNDGIWVEYEKQYQLSFKLHDDIRLATQFYRDNIDALREGAVVSWEARFNDDEVDALQHAMNLKIRDEYAFWAEMQNEPKRRQVGETNLLKTNEIILKTNGHPRFEVPFGSHWVTIGVDVQKYCLYYTVFAWEPNGNCYLIDYGAWPDQKKDYFTYDKIENTYFGKAQGGYGADLYKCLKEFVPTLMSREWMANDGTILKADQMLIDANWEPSKNAIYKYCRSSPYGNTIFPSHGRYFGAIKAPMSDMKEKPGEKRGDHWIITYPKTAQTVRYVVVDTNYWKSWVHERISTDMAGEGCMSFFGKDPMPIRMFADQVTAEYVVKVEAKGREVEEWSPNVGKPDNHFLDTTCLAAVGASMRGLNLGNAVALVPAAPAKPTMTMSERLAENRRRRGR